MPTVFISYSREDLEYVQRLEEELTRRGIGVWRDQEKLYAGQKWPKALGEAILANNFFLLIWSKNAAASENVELEWNTAIALKKEIIPCLKDETLLPLILRAINGIPSEDIDRAIPKLIEALQRTPHLAEHDHSIKVISELSSLKSDKPQEVLEQIKGLIDHQIEPEKSLSILVRSFNDAFSSQLKSPDIEVNAVFETWIKACSSPLILVLDFAPDVLQTLFAIHKKLDNSPSKRFILSWIPGEKLIDTDISPKSLVTDLSITNTPNSKPFLFLVDFSQVKLDDVFVSISADATNLSKHFNKTMSEFCRLTTSNGHHVIIALPRFMLTLLKPDFLQRYSSWTLISTELFSDKYIHRANDCEKLIESLLGEKWKLDDVLRRLISANSSTLPQTVAEFIVDFSQNKPLQGNVNDLKMFLKLAEKLTNEGFYEIAFRLEVYCRTLAQQQSLISLDANIKWKSQQLIEEKKQSLPQDEDEHKIVGYIQEVKKTPAVVDRGVLTGESGAGKSTALFQMENFWSLPQINLDEAKHPCWLPIFIALNIEPGLNLSQQLQSHLNYHSYLERGERYRLTCHHLLSGIASTSNLQYLFSSSSYFLLDGVDEISIDQRQYLEKDLRNLDNLAKEGYEPGYLLAFRVEEVEVTEFSDLPSIQIRPMNANQINEFIKKRGKPQSLQNSLQNFLGTNDKPISRCLNNPYLLTLICKMDLDYTVLNNFNLQKILDMQHSVRSRSRNEELAYRITEICYPR